MSAPLAHTDLKIAAAQLTTFYKPNPYKHGRMTGLSPNTQGQLVKRCTTLEGQAVTPDVLMLHLQGRPGCLAIGYLPGDNTGTTAGMIDLDAKDYTKP